MKKKLGICVIIILTLISFGFLIYISKFSFFIIVAEMSEERAKIVSNQVITEISPFYGIVFLGLTILNFIILKKVLLYKQSFTTSLIISILTLIISIIFLFEFKNKFIEQNKLDYERIKNLQNKENRR